MAVLWSEDNTLDSDWIKTLSWDLPREPQSFLRSLKGRSLESFMALPAAQAMPESLRQSLGELGYATVLKFAEGQPRTAGGQFASTGGTFDVGVQATLVQGDYSQRVVVKAARGDGYYQVENVATGKTGWVASTYLE